MNSNKFWTAGIGALAVVMLALFANLSLSPSAEAQTYRVLYSFAGQPDGDRPLARVVFDSQGNLYGTTRVGGSNGAGSVFKLAPNPDGSWTESVLYSFHCCADAYFPFAGLILDGQGNLYGTTVNGGGIGQCGGYSGCGTVFKLTANPDGSWSESILHSFTGGMDGGQPAGPLISDSAGNLYSTTVWGGASGLGVVFKLKPNPDGSWTERVLHSFKGKPCKNPEAGLVLDATGNLYGTTFLGGSHNSGTVFQLTPNPGGSWTSKVLHAFNGGSGGAKPLSDLIFDPAGNLYGTTFNGGHRDAGTIFELAPGPQGWTFSILYRFRDQEGTNPRDGLVIDPAGNLYGTTSLDSGGMGHGTVYKLSPNPDGTWTETILHQFQGGSDGGEADSSLIRDAAGNLYGTTAGYHNLGCNDIDGCGTVFEVTP